MRAVDHHQDQAGRTCLRLEERPKPEPGVGQIRVRVRRRRSIARTSCSARAIIPCRPGRPADISGMEYAGEVDALGEAASLWKVGDRVMGLVGGGGHAEYVCVHEREAIPAPEQMSWEDAGAIPEAFLTGYDALFHRLDAQARRDGFHSRGGKRRRDRGGADRAHCRRDGDRNGALGGKAGAREGCSG